MIWHIASENDVKPVQFCFQKSYLIDYIDQKIMEYGTKNADYIIGQAKYQDKYLKENYKRSCNQIIPNMHPLPIEKKHKERPLKIAWVANLKEWKQPHLFIELVKKFANITSIQFKMIGRDSDDKYQNQLRQQYLDLPNFEYIGEKSIAQVNYILNQSHILINTSLPKEGFPNSFIQAWLRSVPTISLNVDPDDVIKKYRLGFHSGAFDQMVSDLESLIFNEELLNKMSENARQYAEKHHSLEGNISKILAVFENV